MASTKPLIFYDLVPNHSGTAPFFSPATTRVRLALLLKGVPFVTRELTYGDLRSKWCGLNKSLNVENATAPFIELPDGTFIMDGFRIVEWLDAEFPDRPNIYLPEAPLPVDVTSAEYQAAVNDFQAFRRAIASKSVFYLYAPKLVALMSPEAESSSDQAYFTGEARLTKAGFSTWDSILSTNRDDLIAEMKASQAKCAAFLMAPNGFLSSATKPGFKDFSLYGAHRMLASVDPVLTRELWTGELGSWVDRMNKLFAAGPEGMDAVRARDPKE